MRFETRCDNGLSKLAVFEAKNKKLLPWQQFKKSQIEGFEIVCDNGLSKLAVFEAKN